MKLPPMMKTPGTRQQHVPSPSAAMFGSLAALITACTLSTAAPAMSAQPDYPSKPIRLLVGFPAGSPPDSVARLVGDRIGNSIGQPVVVENVAGAGGNIAADRVAKAEPDGHTLLMAGNAAIVINRFIYEKLPYDPVNDFAPVSQVVSTPNVLVVNPGVPAKSVQELVAMARGRSEALKYAHAGIGVSQHLAAEQFKQEAGIAMEPIAYRGANTILPDLVAGRVDVCFCNIVTALPLVRAGKLRALAVASTTRSDIAPDLPTVAESGFPGFESTAWFGLMAPAGTPATVIAKLHRETAKALGAPDLRKTLTSLGMTAIGNDPAAFASVIATETAYWDGFLKKLAVKIK